MPIAVIGVFFLTSMVIARFELAYGKYKGILSEVDLAQNKFALGVAFAMSTETEMHADAFVDMMARFWDCSGVHLTCIQDRMAGFDDATKLVRSVSTLLEDSPAPTVSLSSALRQDDGGLRLAREPSTPLSPLSPLKAIARLLFDICDQDKSSTISFKEFQWVLAVSDCVTIINESPIIGFQTVASRMELLLKDSWAKVARLAEDKVEARARVMDSIARHTFVLHKAVDRLNECKSQIHGSLRVTRHFTMARLDQLTMGVLLCHMLVLSLWGETSGINEEDQLYAWQIGFCCFYTAEMCARLNAAKSWIRFSNDPRGGMYSFRNKLSFALWLIYGIGTSVAPVRKEHHGFWTAVSSLVLWRIFVVSPSFRDLCYSVTRGLGTVSSLLFVFMIIFYVYAYAAYILFRNVDFGDSNISFLSFPQSCLTMAQVWLGEGYVGHAHYAFLIHHAHYIPSASRCFRFPCSLYLIDYVTMLTGGMRSCTTHQTELTNLSYYSMVLMSLSSWFYFLNY